MPIPASPHIEIHAGRPPMTSSQASSMALTSLVRPISGLRGFRVSSAAFSVPIKRQTLRSKIVPIDANVKCRSVIARTASVANTNPGDPTSPSSRTAREIRSSNSMRASVAVGAETRALSTIVAIWAPVREQSSQAACTARSGSSSRALG